jgi:hypothetical protein
MLSDYTQSNANAVFTHASLIVFTAYLQVHFTLSAHNKRKCIALLHAYYTWCKNGWQSSESAAATQTNDWKWDIQYINETRYSIDALMQTIIPRTQYEILYYDFIDLIGAMETCRYELHVISKPQEWESL